MRKNKERAMRRRASLHNSAATLAGKMRDQQTSRDVMSYVVNASSKSTGKLSIDLGAGAGEQFRGAMRDAVIAFDENVHLRRMVAFLYCGVGIYTDDGELHDSSAIPAIDFKHDAVADIVAKMRTRADKAVEDADGEPQQ